MGFGKRLAGIGGGLLGAGGGLLGALGLGTKSLLDRAGELGKLAEKLGVPVEQLSAFAYAADTTGQSLEDLAGHFENLAERVAQGANGAGEAAETFKKLGIDANALKLQNPVDQLITIAEAMAKVTNETERLGMLSSLGGDQFQNLNALFKKGPAGIRALMAEAKLHDSLRKETP
jgi:ribosomal protein L12E/L44/L45/RPP1/RPP2